MPTDRLPKARSKEFSLEQMDLSDPWVTKIVSPSHSEAEFKIRWEHSTLSVDPRTTNRVMQLGTGIKYEDMFLDLYSWHLTITHLES